MIKLVNRVLRDERGVSAIEYAVLLGVVVVAVAAAGAVLTTGSYSFSTIYTTLMTKVSTTVNGS